MGHGQSLCVLIALLAGGCQAAKPEPNRALMDAIETGVVLPPNSVSIDRYSKYFAPDKGGNIEVLYVVHYPGYVDDLRETCAHAKEEIFPCLADGQVRIAAPGTRMWLKGADDLPVPSGSGCAAITFSCDPRTGARSAPECNAPY